ncbi:shikimate dehydrogenase [uncultured Robinsoniella sp.]|uniref:shikimate dehydrogenase n=1 Tax=uncultured Robinsoniella sp. TaxID=904190 RepID=UPI00374E7F35
MAKNYRSQLVGVFGCPVDENPTGVMEEAAFAKMGLDYRYLTIKVEKDDLEAAMRAVRAFGMKGINLTIPHKVKVLSYLDELSEAAKIIGAVNTVVNRDGKLFGENTDGKGFLTALKNEGTEVKNKKIVMLGAGGAARAIGVECALAGALEITVVNRNEERGAELAGLIETKTDTAGRFVKWEGSYPVPEDTDILINATCVGLYPNVSDKPEINYDTIKPGMTVSDVVFNDPNTRFLQEAGQRGAKTVNGLGMLAQQGALNFTLWTGADAPVEVMEDTLKQEFGLSK